MDDPEMQQAGIRLRRGEQAWLWVFLAPTLVGLLLGTLGPVLAAVSISFTSGDVLTPPAFVGLANYDRLIHDPTFAKALGNTAYYVAGMVPAATILSLLLAMVMNQKLRGITWYRTVYFMPVVSSAVAVALVWAWIYQQDYGLLNFLLRSVGLEPIKWLGSSRWAMPAVIIMGIWGHLGEGMVIFLAGLQSIPESYYEAAGVDGANLRPDVGVALIDVEGEAAHDQGVEIRMEVGIEEAHRGYLHALLGEDESLERLRVEGQPAREHLKQHGARG